MSEVCPPSKQRPVWAIAGLSEGVPVRRVVIGERSKRCKHGGEPMFYNGKAIGKSEQPLYAAARWLLANNAASESDTVATYRGETLCMHGKVGDLAKWTVAETKHGNPSLCLRPYVPFSTLPVGSLTPKTLEPYSGVLPSEGAVG